MKNFPKYLSTKHDYEYIRAAFPPEQWKPKWRQLLDSRFTWEDCPEEEAPGAAAEATRFRTIERTTPGMGAAETNEPKTVRQRLVEDPASRIFRLGFTVREVEEALS